MATPVPYSGAPQVAPTDQPVPYRQLNVPAGAFGLGQAEATQQLGGAFKEAGGEIYARAVAMQELSEQAKANEAVANAQQDQMKGYLDFTQLRGKDASDGYPGFIDSMNSIRMQNRANLSSPYAQRLYDNESRNATNRIVFSGGVHAKDQLKTYTNDSLKAGVVAAQRQIGINPEDENGFQSYLGTIEEKARAIGKGEGWDQQKTDNFVAQQKEQAAVGRIEALGEGKWLIAGDLKDKYIKSGLISDPKEIRQLNQFIDSKIHNEQSRVTASDIIAGRNHEFGNQILPPEKARIGIAGAEGPSYQQLGPTIESGKYKGERALGHYQVMPGNLKSWLAEAGMPDMTKEAFLANNAAQDQLFDTRFGARQKALGSFNRAALEWFTGNPDVDLDSRGDGYHTPRQYLDIANAALVHSASGTENSANARKVAGGQRPNDPIYPDYVETKLRTDLAGEERDKRQDQMAAEQSVASAFLPGQDGKLPVNKDQLLSNPDTAAAWKKLKPSQQIGWENRLAANARNGGYALTPESQQQYDHYMGLALSDDLDPTQKEELLNFDAATSKIPYNMVGKILSAKDKIFKGMTVDPHIGHAMDLLKDTLSEAGIVDKKSDKGAHDDYLKFKSSLHDVMENFALRNKGQMKDEDIIEAGSRLIQSMPTGKQSFHLWGWGPHWEDDQSKLYQMPVPPEVAKIIVQKYQARRGVIPSPAKIQSIYTANKFQEQVDKSADKRFWQMPND